MMRWSVTPLDARGKRGRRLRWHSCADRSSATAPEWVREQARSLRTAMSALWPLTPRMVWGLRHQPWSLAMARAKAGRATMRLT
jgi:hypothetical protein